FLRHVGRADGNKSPFRSVSCVESFNQHNVIRFQESEPMNVMRGILALGALGAVTLAPLVEASTDENFATGHAVFVMNNDAEANEVIAYQRTTYGTLFSPRKFKTGGR